MISHEDDPTFRRINSGMQHWSVSRAADGRQLLRHQPLPVGARRHVRRRPGARSCRASSSVTSTTVGTATPTRSTPTIPTRRSPRRAPTDAVVHRHMTTGFHLPFTVRSTIRYEDGLEHILLLCSTPVDDERSLFTFVVWRNDDFDRRPPGGDRVRSCDRRRGPADARTGPRHDAARSHRSGQRAGRSGRRSSGGVDSPRWSE